MEKWSEEELQKLSEERGSGIPEGMEVWTEEELKELAEKRQGGLNIPEWEPDPEMKECSKCGYGLRKGWTECPICGTPIDASGETEQLESDQLESESEESDQNNGLDE
jgi:hypothetical protein